MIKKEKRIPLRKCTICGEHKDKFNLIRVVKNKDEGISVDLTYKKNGRGAYICKSMEASQNYISILCPAFLRNLTTLSRPSH